MAIEIVIAVTEKKEISGEFNISITCNEKKPTPEEDNLGNFIIATLASELNINFGKNKRDEHDS
ncbi:hypothetical protein [Providencia hangzhouensis]